MRYKLAKVSNGGDFVDTRQVYTVIGADYLCSFWYHIRPTVTGQRREKTILTPAKSLKSASNYIFRVPSVDELSAGTT
jgi:hypothetical protein